MVLSSVCGAWLCSLPLVVLDCTSFFWWWRLIVLSSFIGAGSSFGGVGLHSLLLMMSGCIVLFWRCWIGLCWLVGVDWIMFPGGVGSSFLVVSGCMTGGIGLSV